MKTKKIFAVLLATSMLLAMGTGCKTKSQNNSKSFRIPEQENPTGQVDTIKRENGQTAIFELSSETPASMSDEQLVRAYSEFEFNLLSQCASDTDTNLMISPDSVLFALDMVAAGASGETLNQLLATTVPGADQVSAFSFAKNRMASLRGDQLQIANSAWFNKDREVPFYEDYLTFIHDNFDAEVSTLSMDGQALDTINGWISDHTKGRIPKMLNVLDPNTACLLVNAMVFDGTWKNTYEDWQIYEDDFHQTSTTSQKVTYLFNTESIYVRNDSAQGFIKLYDGDQYAFMTILPNDSSISINEYVSNMTASDYWELWDNRDYTDVEATFPEFTSGYRTNMEEYLQAMGVKDAFQGNADFSNMSSESPHISEVIHQTYIKVDRNGTEAAAATVVAMEDGCALVEDPIPVVKCDRPFAYAIVDMETGLPVFIGTVNNVESPS